MAPQKTKVKGEKGKLRNYLSSVAGFTFLELLIVIAVIAIFAVITFMTIGTKQLAQARDARRKTDLRNIGYVLESYYALHGNYPYDPGDPEQIEFFSETANPLWIPDVSTTEKVTSLPLDPNQTAASDSVPISTPIPASPTQTPGPDECQLWYGNGAFDNPYPGDEYIHLSRVQSGQTLYTQDQQGDRPNIWFFGKRSNTNYVGATWSLNTNGSIYGGTYTPGFVYTWPPTFPYSGGGSMSLSFVQPGNGPRTIVCRINSTYGGSLIYESVYNITLSTQNAPPAGSLAPTSTPTPIPITRYLYRISEDYKSYEVWARLENTNDPLINNCGTPPILGFNYCVKSN